jgi:hypothetical protein
LNFNLSLLTTQNYPESKPKYMDKGGQGMDNQARPLDVADPVVILLNIVTG